MDKQIKNGLEEIIAQYEFFSSTTRSTLWKTFFWRHALIFPAIPAFILIQIEPFKLTQISDSFSIKFEELKFGGVFVHTNKFVNF